MGLFTPDSQRNLCRKKRRRLMTTVGGSTIAAVALLGGKVAQGLALEGVEGVNLEAFSPYAQMTVVEGEVGRDDMSFFQVQTEAWKSTRVRVSIDDCSPLTAVIASFGAEPAPSRHDFLAHATLDTDGNGTCGVDVISRPSFTRDGFWHFAVVGGDPLLGNRYFAGPPDMLKFEAVIAAESAVYPSLDRGVAPWGYCVRRVSTPPASVPIIRYRAGESGGGDFLPTIGRFPPVSDTVMVDSYKNENDEHASQEAKRAASWPHWLGDFTVSAYDEVVTIHFELAALVDGKPVARKKHISEDHPVTGGRRDGARSGGIEGGSEISKRRNGRGRALMSQAEQEENKSFHRYERHGNDGNGDVCGVILCAAAGVISLGFPHDPIADAKLGEWRSGDETSVCKLATVERNGTAVSGILELSQRHQAGRWYLTARANCGSSSPHFRHGRHLGQEFSGEPSNRSTDGTTEGVDDAFFTASSINSPFNNSSDTATDVASEGRETKQGGLDKDSGWGGLKVLSMQRDWAHMEWKADALVPDGSENGADPETCPSVVDARDAIELRAAVITQACPMGAVGVGGVDMTFLDVGDGSNSSSSGGSSGEASRRFACVGTLLPMTMSRSGAEKVYEGRPRALSNLLLDEGGASKEKDGVEDEPSRWMWRGPRPPSVWYAVDMNGREIGASVGIKLTVNSSAPASDATRSALDSPSAWRMGPYSESGEGEFGVDGWGCPLAENGTLPLHEEAFFNITVAVRAGAFPDVDVNGTAGEGTWVFHTNEALREAVELEPCPDFFGSENAFSSSEASQNGNNEDDDDGGNDPVTARWSTTFTWNMTRPPPSVGGDFATTLFVAVYGDTIDDAEVSREGEDRGVDGGDDAELLWALGVATRVSFSYCTEDTCPRDRGQCRTTSSSGDEYVKISKCYCFYGYGGEACAYRTISVVFRVWKFFCLVFSNLAVIPGVRVALSLGAAIGAAPAVVLSLTGIASAFYHMCDLDFTCAAGFLSYHSLQALDFFFSFFAIAVLILHLCPMPWDEPLVVMPRATSTPTSTASGNSNNYQIEAEGGFNESSENPDSGREAPFGGVDSTGVGDETLVGDHEGRQPDDPEVRGSSSAMMHGGSLEEEKEEEEEEEKERRGDKGGTRLAALYACLIPPLLVSVTDNPTAGVNLAVEFVLCVALLVFSWGRLVARDARGWRSEATAKLDEEWMEEGQWERSGGIVPGDAGTEASNSIGGRSAGEASRVNVNVDETEGVLPNPWGPFMEGEEQEEVDEGQGEVEDRRGQGEERGNASVVRYRNSSPAASSRRKILRGRGREAAFGGDSNEGGSLVVGSGQGQSFGFWYSGGKLGVKSPCHDMFQSLRRVAVDRGLLDWRQLGIGVIVFTLGLACFVLQGIPGNANSYHLWHSAWHILAMGSAVPILKARRWGREVETSVGAVACSGRGEMRGEPGSRWNWKLMTYFRRCGAPVGSPTYEMVPDP